MIRNTLCNIHQVSRAAADYLDKEEKTAMLGVLREAQEVEIAFKIQSQEQLYKKDPSRSILSRIYEFVGSMLLRNNPIPFDKEWDQLKGDLLLIPKADKEMECFKNGKAELLIVSAEACRIRREVDLVETLFPLYKLIKKDEKKPDIANDITNREIFRKKDVASSKVDSGSFLGGFRLSPVEGMGGELIYRTGTNTCLVNQAADAKVKGNINQRENLGRKALAITALGLAVLGIGTALYARIKAKS